MAQKRLDYYDLIPMKGFMKQVNVINKKMHTGKSFVFEVNSLLFSNQGYTSGGKNYLGGIRRDGMKNKYLSKKFKALKAVRLLNLKHRVLALVQA